MGCVSLRSSIRLSVRRFDILVPFSTQHLPLHWVWQLKEGLRIPCLRFGCSEDVDSIDWNFNCWMEAFSRMSSSKILLTWQKILFCLSISLLLSTILFEIVSLWTSISETSYQNKSYLKYSLLFVFFGFFVVQRVSLQIWTYGPSPDDPSLFLF